MPRLTAKFGGLGLGMGLGGGGAVDTPPTPPPEGLVRQYTAKGTLYTDAAGTDLVDANLDPIGFITDMTLGGDDAIQSTSFSKAKWLSSGPSMNFDGGDHLVCGSKITAESTLVLVAQRNSSSTLSPYGEADNVSQYTYLDAGNGVLRIQRNADGVANYDDLSAAQGEKFILFLTFDYVTSNLVRAYRYTGGSLVQSSNVTAPAVTLSVMTTGYLGAKWLGALGTFWLGNIFEQRIFDSIVPEADMAIQGAALAAEWGVS